MAALYKARCPQGCASSISPWDCSPCTEEPNLAGDKGPAFPTALPGDRGSGRSAGNFGMPLALGSGFLLCRDLGGGAGAPLSPRL